MRHVDGPGPWHEATEVDCAFYVRPTETFAARFDMGWAILLLAAVVLLRLPFWVPFVIFAGLMALFAFACVLYYLFPARRREPLVVTPGGRIEYMGRELRPEGPVQAVRMFRREQGADDLDTYHIEVLSEGSAVELPAPAMRQGRGAEGGRRPGRMASRPRWTR